MKYLIAVLLIVAVSDKNFGQAKVRKLSTSINHPSINAYAPFVSADGSAMIFLTDNAEDGVLTPFYTFRGATDWSEPRLLPKNLHSRLNFLRGYGLGADGKKIFISTVKGPAVGGYDIWWSEWKGSSWSDPVNFGLPVNTKENEACASVTPDGNTMYFMRCSKMDQAKASGCRIIQIKKKANGQWDEPIELPANINGGNSQAPRIMADGETLIFSSDKHAGNKGGMDLYMSKAAGGGKWSDPLPLDFVNTSTDDQYVSVTAVGRYLMRDSPGPKRNEIVEYLFPNELRPKALMEVEGTISDGSGSFVPSYISILDLGTGRQIYNGRPGADGSFSLYLKEGSTYILSVDPEKDNFTYYARKFDLTSGTIPQGEKVVAILKEARAGDSVVLEDVNFQPYTSSLMVKESTRELQKFIRLLRGNPALKAEVQVEMTGYEEDSIQSGDDMTEIYYDSVLMQYEITDSTGATFQMDTLFLEPTYHNDRTLAQAQAIANYLISQGIDGSRLSFSGRATEAVLPDEQKTTVKVVLR